MKEFKERGFNDELDLDTLFVVFLNRINSLLLIFGFSTIILLIVYSFQERIYQSKALLQFEQNSSAILPSSISDFSQKSTLLSAEKEIFKSFSTIDGVKNRLKNSYGIDLGTSTISSGISFSDDKRNLLTIFYKSNEKDLTKPVLNSLIEEFISDRIENSRVAAIKGIEFIENEIPKLRDQLNSAEIELANYKSSGGNNLIFNDNSGETINSLLNEIKAIEFKEIELREFYKESHPIYSTLLKQKSILSKELSELESGAQDLPTEQRKLFNLNQRVNIYSSSVEELEREKLSLGLVAASSTSNIRVINKPSDAVKISPSISILLLGIVIFLVAYIIFILDHFLTDKIMSLDSLLDYLEDRQLLLGAFPLINKRNSNIKILKEIEKNFSDRILVNILSSENKVFLIASMKGGVGKSYFSEKLVNNLSNFSEKICLLDLDLRKKGLSDYSKIFKEDGISTEDYLSGNFESKKVMLLKKPSFNNPLSFLNSSELEVIINKLRKDFDKIIIDSPPMGTFVDARIISEFCDQTICILSSHESSFAEISSISKELTLTDRNNGNVIFFLNKVRYFLEIFWFNVRYPIYGSYNYYNPYNYYYGNDSKNFRKLEKYVSFALNYLKNGFFDVKNYLKKLFKKKK